MTNGFTSKTAFGRKSFYCRKCRVFVASLDVRKYNPARDGTRAEYSRDVRILTAACGEKLNKHVCKVE